MGALKDQSSVTEPMDRLSPMLEVFVLDDASVLYPNRSELWNNDMTDGSIMIERRFPSGKNPATSDPCNYLGFAKEKTSSLMFIDVHCAFPQVDDKYISWPWFFHTSSEAFPLPKFLGWVSCRSRRRVLHRHVFTSARQTERKLVMIIPSLPTNSNKINPITNHPWSGDLKLEQIG